MCCDQYSNLSLLITKYPLPLFPKFTLFLSKRENSEFSHVLGSKSVLHTDFSGMCGPLCPARIWLLLVWLPRSTNTFSITQWSRGERTAIKSQLRNKEVGISSVQFSSVTQLCLTLCNPMNHSMPGLPVHHKLLEFTQTHAHQVCDAIQPSPPLSSSSPPAPNPSKHQGLFQ